MLHSQGTFGASSTPSIQAETRYLKQKSLIKNKNVKLLILWDKIYLLPIWGNERLSSSWSHGSLSRISGMFIPMPGAQRSLRPFNRPRSVQLLTPCGLWICRNSSAERCGRMRGGLSGSHWPAGGSGAPSVRKGTFP